LTYVAIRRIVARHGCFRLRARSLPPYLPLTPALFHVLLSLADGQKHGYAILKEVGADRRQVELSTGTLYGIIKRLLADGSDPRLRARQHRPPPRLPPHAFGRKVALAEAERHARPGRHRARQ
jgi:hypothetical protein